MRNESTCQHIKNVLMGWPTDNVAGSLVLIARTGMSIPICITGEQVSGVIKLITMYCCHICYSIHEVRIVDNIANDGEAWPWERCIPAESVNNCNWVIGQQSLFVIQIWNQWRT